MMRLLFFTILAWSFASAQIGEPLPQFLGRLTSLELQETAQGYSTGSVALTPELRNERLFGLSGQATLNPVGRAALAQLVGAASGYGEGITQPIQQFLTDRIGELAGQGPIPLGVEEFVLTLNVTGKAAPYKTTFELELLSVPETTFPKAQHTLGPKDATFVIREFSDFQCPYCAQFAQNTLPLIKKQLLQRGDVRFEFHHFPLTTIHANAQLAGEAAECVTAANTPRDFWTYHDALYTRQQAWQGLGDAAPYFVRLARELDLSDDGVAACLEEGRYTKLVQDAYTVATQTLALNSTPTVFVGGYKLSASAAGTLPAYERAMARLEAFGP